MVTLNGIYLGMRDGKPMAYTGDRHAMLLGPTGAGKSSLIIPTLASSPRSMLVLDPKAEVCSVVAERRRHYGDVVVFNPFDEMVDVYPDLKSDGFNPLASIDPDTEFFVEDCLTIADAYVVDNAGTQDKHWVEAARDLLTALIMFECTHEDPSLVNVREMLALPHERE